MEHLDVFNHSLSMRELFGLAQGAKVFGLFFFVDQYVLAVHLGRVLGQLVVSIEPVCNIKSITNVTAYKPDTQGLAISISFYKNVFVLLIFPMASRSPVDDHVHFSPKLCRTKVAI